MTLFTESSVVSMILDITGALSYLHGFDIHTGQSTEHRLVYLLLYQNTEHRRDFVLFYHPTPQFYMMYLLGFATGISSRLTS